METFSRGTLDPQWVTGFADSAASLTYSRSGHQLALYFAIKAERPVLEELQQFFQGAGRIYDVGASASYFRVSRRDELMFIVEHFDAYPLRSSKQQVFDLWRQMVIAKQQFRKPDRDLLDSLAGQITALSAR